MNEMPTVATVRILDKVQSREGKNGKPSYFQQATIECDQFRVKQDVFVDGPNAGYVVGQVYEWNPLADLQIGQYQRIELARRMTLVAKAAPAAK